MSEQRIFIATKKDLSIAVIGNVEAKTATSTKVQHTTSQQGIAGVREVALKGAIEAIKGIDTKELTAPVQVFVIGYLADMIANQTYKYWNISGKKNDGTDVDSKELALWKEFDKLMSKKGSFVIFKDLSSANFKGTPKYNRQEIAYNKFYYDWAWKAMHSIYPQGPEAPGIPEEAI